jgi:hypothetical protein
VVSVTSALLYSQSKVPGIVEFPPHPYLIPVPIRINSIPPKFYYYSITTNCEFEFLGCFETDLWQKWFNETEQNHSKFQAIIASPTRLDDSKIEVSWGKECR